MELLLNQLINCQNKDDFFKILSSYYQKDFNLEDLQTLDTNTRQTFLRLYQLIDTQPLFKDYPTLLLENALYGRTKISATSIWTLFQQESRRFFQLAIIKGSSLSTKKIVKQIIQLVRNTLYLEQNDHFILFFTFDHGPYSSLENQHSIENLLKSGKLQAYFSFPYDRFEDTAIFYYPLNLLASKNQNNRTITFLEDVYFETLLDNFSQPELLHSFIHSQIQRIIHHDQKYHTPYYLTLKSYLKNKRDIQTTINELQINRSTLFYRFKQIGKMLDQDFYSLDLFTFEVSIRIYDYLNKN